MRTEYVCPAGIPDGYFDEKVNGQLCYDPETKNTYAVYPFGWHTAEIPPANSVEEVIWLLNHHPILTGRFTL